MKFRSDIVVDLIDFMGGDQKVVQAARVSTKGAESVHALEGGTGLIKYLMREGHLVPFEHSVFTFYVNAPIFVTRQLLKHRISSISEESGRYRELDGEFYVPPSDRPLVQVGKTGDYVFTDAEEWQEAMVSSAILEGSEAAWGQYLRMLSGGVAKEVARMVLPVNLYSSLYITINAVSLMNIIRLRTMRFGSHPQFEIALLGEAMYAEFRNKMPVSAEAFALSRGDALHVHDNGE
jgi:thymidylate synthase (FAD)